MRTKGWHRSYECPNDKTRWTITGGKNPGCPTCGDKGRWVDAVAEQMPADTITIVRCPKEAVRG